MDCTCDILRLRFLVGFYYSKVKFNLYTQNQTFDRLVPCYNRLSMSNFRKEQYLFSYASLERFYLFVMLNTFLIYNCFILKGK